VSFIPSTKAKQRTYVDGLIKECLTRQRWNVMYYALVTLRENLHNRKPVHRGACTSVSIDDVIRDKVLALHAAHPDWNYEQIAHAVGINIGRVSEILAGKRT
jgi:hypothetical protein